MKHESGAFTEFSAGDHFRRGADDETIISLGEEPISGIGELHSQGLADIGLGWRRGGDRTWGGRHGCWSTSGPGRWYWRGLQGRGGAGQYRRRGAGRKKHGQRHGHNQDYILRPWVVAPAEGLADTLSSAADGSDHVFHRRMAGTARHL